MKDISAGLKSCNYIGSRKVKNLFKELPFEVKIKDIKVNGQIRGCSGFITNTENGKICYIDTEPFFDGGKGSGLYNNSNMAIMMRTAKHDKDYTGGMNNWLPASDIVDIARRLTQ